MEEYSGYVGLDVHKDTIAVAIAYPGRSKPKSLGIIAHTKKSLLSSIPWVSGIMTTVNGSTGVVSLAEHAIPAVSRRVSRRV